MRIIRPFSGYFNLVLKNQQRTYINKLREQYTLKGEFFPADNLRDVITKKFVKDLEVLKLKSKKIAIVVNENEELLLPNHLKEKYDCELVNINSIKEQFSYAAVLSILNLHWIDDLDKLLLAINNMLNVGGVLVGVMYGGNTLIELRMALQVVEQERRGGFCNRVSPMAGAKDIATSLNKNMYSAITTDTDRYLLEYPNVITLLQELRLMGESLAPTKPNRPLTKDILIALQSVYKILFNYNNELECHDQKISATFDVISFIGWKHEEQNKCKKMALP